LFAKKFQLKFAAQLQFAAIAANQLHHALVFSVGFSAASAASAAAMLVHQLAPAVAVAS